MSTILVGLFLINFGQYNVKLQSLILFSFKKAIFICITAMALGLNNIFLIPNFIQSF